MFITSGSSFGPALGPELGPESGGPEIGGGPAGKPGKPGKPPRPRIGLALAGGGPLAAVYEIGALAALEESIEGLDVNDAHIYVGISAGSIVAAGLANGISPHGMVRMFIESDSADDAAQGRNGGKGGKGGKGGGKGGSKPGGSGGFSSAASSGAGSGASSGTSAAAKLDAKVDAALGATDSGEVSFRPEMLLKPAFAEFGKRAATVPGLLAGGLLHYLRAGGKRSFASSFERLKEALPTGIFSGDGIHQFLEATFDRPGRSNDFRQLRRRLVIVATDLDSGKAVRFGGDGWDGVPVSLAAQASAAVPGLFPPVEIGGRHFIDGAVKKTLHASIALEAGVDVLLCLNPIVPYNSEPGVGPGPLARGGLINVLSQALRALLHSRIETGMANYARTYPEQDIFLFEPSGRDSEMFLTNMFSYQNRRKMCESAYQSTRMMLWERRAEFGPRLARHGLRLKLAILQDTSMTLVNPPGRRKGRGTLDGLSGSLDDLERYLKVANG